MAAIHKMRSDFKIYAGVIQVILVILFCSNRQIMLPEHGPDIIVKLKLLSCKKNSSLLDASFHMSVNQIDNHHGGPISLGIFMKANDANLF